jgi:hypothetical protein
MNSNLATTATFGPAHTLTVSVVGNGALTSNPPGINCVGNGSGNSGVCSAAFLQGTLVTLIPTPAAGYSLAAWGGNGGCTGIESACGVTMSSDLSASASFGPSESVTIFVTGNGTGFLSGNETVVSTPPGIDCTYTGTNTSGTCSTNFAQGTQLTLTETSSPEYTFIGWTGGGCSGGAGTCSLTLNSALTTTATFNVNP